MKTVFTTRKNHMANDCADLFELLQSMLRCSYISDLRTEPYSTEARQILKYLDLDAFNPCQVNDVYKYIGVSL